MALQNTGYKGYSTLLKVTSDGRALDINNTLCSVTGLPQSTKANSPGDPNYVAPVYDTGTCPLPTFVPAWIPANAYCVTENV